MKKGWVCPKCLTPGFYDEITRINGENQMKVKKCNNCNHIQEDADLKNESVIGEIITNDGTLIN